MAERKSIFQYTIISKTNLISRPNLISKPNLISSGILSFLDVLVNYWYSLCDL